MVSAWSLYQAMFEVKLPALDATRIEN